MNTKANGFFANLNNLIFSTGAISLNDSYILASVIFLSIFSKIKILFISYLDKLENSYGKSPIGMIL
jgi:hypothetical protein